MPKVGMEQLRRRQLIEATIASIHEEGLANTTIQRISRRAGLSSGIVAHYFEDKAGLLEATMRSLAEDLRLSVVPRLRAARTPEERLAALIDANFAADLSSPEVETVWLSFWGQVRQSPNLARIQRIYERRMQSNLLFALRRLMPGPDAERAAKGLAALIDGLWVKCALRQLPLDGNEAREIARDYLATSLAQHGQPPRSDP